MADKTSKIKILVVDDSYPSRILMMQAFRGEFHVICAQNGEEALKMMESEEGLSLVLLDLNMPVMDGFTVLKRVVLDEKICKIPIVAVTSGDDVENLIRALDLGAVDVLTKPLNLQLVAHRIRNILTRTVPMDGTDKTALFQHIIKHNEIDDKTGLYNREKFCHEARLFINNNPKEKFVLFRWDIDGFKFINDVYGISEGDRLLTMIGRMYIDRADDSIMRYGRWEADHFVTLMKLEEFNRYHVPEMVNAGFNSSNLSFEVVIRMGVYVVDDPGLDISIMCDRALMALRTIKGNYTDRVAFYDDSMRRALIESQEIVSEMENALGSGQFEVYIQPQYNYSDCSLYGAEALVRWKHPSKGMISPAVFIPIFERNGFITHLDRFVWEEVCWMQRKWLDSGHEIIPISVNVSRTDVSSLKLNEHFTSLVQKYNLPTSAIRIEITESAYMDNPGLLINSVEKLQQAGFFVEMDDFGSGYSSLNTLKDVPVDLLKLDMKFIGDGGNKDREGSILSSVVRMSNRLRLPVLAEGVETKEQADYLKSIGCVFMQGYYFAKPMPVEEFEKILFAGRLTTFSDRKAEESITKAYEFLNASTQATLLFNNLVGGAAILEYHDGQVETVRVNDRFFEVVDVPRKVFDPVKDDTLALYDKKYRKGFIDMLEKAIAENTEAECEMYSEKAGRSMKIWTKVRVKLLAKNWDSYLFYMTIENVTEKMNLLIDNIELADRLAGIVNSVPGGIADYRFKEGKITLTYFNERMCEMFGYSKSAYEKEFATDPLKAVCPDDIPALSIAINDIVNGKVDHSRINFRHICTDGSWKWVSLSASVTARKGKTVCIASILIDIDDQARAMAHTPD